MSTTTTRTRRTTLDLPGSPIDVLYESDHKLALEGTSPKPCIVPGNALHLIDDDPSAPHSATPPSLIIVGDEPEGESEYEGEGGDEDGEGVGGGKPHSASRSASQPAAAGTRPTPHVRFRSRVRITSGVHRHRHSHSHSHSQSGTGAPGSSTPGSSTEDSPSSSISAPLRYQADENATWGPIGKRLSGYAAGGWQRRPERVQGLGQRHVQVQVQGQDGQRQGVYGARSGGARGRGARGGRGYHERTPLLRPSPGRMYSESEDDSEEVMGEGERTARAAALSREEEAVFGKWPWRIFNRHWWWWHVEPALGCCCSDESDYEEY
ncbi:hypothetical protein C8Q74DRAFT_1206818 [Fomes fomentarius]|nr:hypothetical protein C8Q74DRAFT_1206818 [Fomes fomentarius]